MADEAPQLRGEPRKLSSVSTEVGAVVGVLIASLTTVAALVALFTGSLGVVVAMLGASAAIWSVVLVGSPKAVETDGYWLLVTDFSKTVWIPLRQIASVQETLVSGWRRRGGDASVRPCARNGAGAWSFPRAPVSSTACRW